jgi:type II secretory pathway component GspD/PulD (secretin)
MVTSRSRIWLPACLALAAAAASAQDRPAGAPAQPGPPPGATTQLVMQQPAPQPNLPPAPVLPTVALDQLLERVARKSDKQFLVDYRVGQQLYLGGARLDDVDYPLLLSILRNNNLAAVEIQGRVNIVSVFEIRAYAVPFANTDDPKIADDEWVTRVLTTTGEAAQLVPILRPMLPQQAHLAANPPHKLIIVDRYSNVKRITEIVRQLDR